MVQLNERRDGDEGLYGLDGPGSRHCSTPFHLGPFLFLPLISIADWCAGAWSGCPRGKRTLLHGGKDVQDCTSERYHVVHQSSKVLNESPNCTSASGRPYTKRFAARRHGAPEPIRTVLERPAERYRIATYKPGAQGRGRGCGGGRSAMLELLKADLKPSDILKRASFENAITLVMALGGSTNAVLHLLAIAHAANVPLTLDDFQVWAAPTGPFWAPFPCHVTRL